MIHLGDEDNELCSVDRFGSIELKKKLSKSSDWSDPKSAFTSIVSLYYKDSKIHIIGSGENKTVLATWTNIIIIYYY